MRYRLFGDTPLDAITLDHLQRVVDDEVPEGLFVEYKRDWTSQKVARAVASFANSDYGGTLIVGIDATDLTPTGVVGIDTRPGLHERVEQIIRSSITPVPSFATRVVPITEGRVCVVVDVLGGTQPPYILIRTGQVMVRTATTSEPVGINDRTALDRLFARGERGRQWGRKRLDSALEEAALSSNNINAWVVPAVDGGLTVYPRLFRRSFVDNLGDTIRVSWVDPSWTQPRITTGQQFVDHDWTEMTAPLSGGTPTIARMVRGRVWIDGVLHLAFSDRHVDPHHALGVMLDEMLPKVVPFFENVLHHRGDVLLGMYFRWSSNTQGVQRLTMTRGPMPIRTLAERALAEELIREATRSQPGTAVYEPESEHNQR